MRQEARVSSSWRSACSVRVSVLSEPTHVWFLANGGSMQMMPMQVLVVKAVAQV